MPTPLISIIIPTYNSAKTLPKCLRHIFNQIYKNLEIIVVNDGSTDETKEILEKYNTCKYNMGSVGSLFELEPGRGLDPTQARSRDLAYPIKTVNQSNQGTPSARNRGFKESNGEYLLFVDADVYLKPACVQKMYQTLEKYPGAAYAYSSFIWGWKKFKLWPFNSEKLKQMPYIHTCSLIRWKCFPSTGWDESLKRFQDWDLWLTMWENGHKGIWIPEVLFTTSTRKNTMSAWVPKFVYNRLPWLAKKRIEEYNKAKEIVLKKHHFT